MVRSQGHHAAPRRPDLWPTPLSGLVKHHHDHRCQPRRYFAGGIGAHVLKNQWGWLLGMVIYLGCPATMALALQDYQDLIFALPALVLCVDNDFKRLVLANIRGLCWHYAERRVRSNGRRCGSCNGPFFRTVGHRIGDTGLEISPSQAWLLLAMPAGQKPITPIDSGHDMPLENALKSLGHNQIFLEGWLYKTRFYALVWIPLGSLAFLSPIVAAPAVGNHSAAHDRA